MIKDPAACHLCEEGSTGTSLASWKPSQGKSAVRASPPLLPPQSSPSVPGPGAERGSSTTSPEKFPGRHRLEAWAVLLQVGTPARQESAGESWQSPD